MMKLTELIQNKVAVHGEDADAAAAAIKWANNHYAEQFMAGLEIN